MGFASLPSTRHLLGRRELEQGSVHAGSKSALLLFNLERTWPKDVKRSCKRCLDTTSPHQLVALNSQQGGLIRKLKSFYHDNLLVSIEMQPEDWKGFCILF